MSASRGILVSGSHRSGTGWVGQVIATSARPVGVVWEPFSLLHRPGTCAVRWGHWFPYVCAENAGGVAGPVGRMLEWRYDLAAEARALRTPKDVGRMGRDAARFARNRRRGALPLLKDPIAVFSLEWLAETFHLAPVLLVRHPAAFAASVKRLRLSHPFSHFLEQPLLMRDRLEPFRAELERFAAADQDIVDQAILLWNVIHDAIAASASRHPGWPLVRLEDLSRDPGQEFAALFEKLELPRGPRTDAFVRETTSPGNPAEATRADSVRRDSRTHVSNWKRRLTDEEVERVRRGTEALAQRFYDPSEW